MKTRVAVLCGWVYIGSVLSAYQLGTADVPVKYTFISPRVPQLEQATTPMPLKADSKHPWQTLYRDPGGIVYEGGFTGIKNGQYVICASYGGVKSIITPPSQPATAKEKEPVSPKP